MNCGLGQRGYPIYHAVTSIKTQQPEFDKDGKCTRKGQCTVMKRSQKPYYKVRLQGQWRSIYAGEGYKACLMRWDMPPRCGANVIIEQQGTPLNIFNPEHYELVVDDQDMYEPVRTLKQIPIRDNSNIHGGEQT